MDLESNSLTSLMNCKNKQLIPERVSIESVFTFSLSNVLYETKMCECGGWETHIHGKHSTDASTIAYRNESKRLRRTRLYR